ncbi:MAG TPA: APC family permease [Acidimicrobiales bacterium]|nr:APC family permease [Acidimicrobiales bacterium]
MYSALKRLLVGRPIATSEQEHQRLRKLVALPTFSSDALSSTAYATEEILFVVAAGTSSLALGLSRLVPISIVVAILLTIVVLSYRQTIYAYPHGGSSYVVSRENLGSRASLVAGASILVDYVLTVAVSISAGVAAIVSLPAFRGWADQRVTLGLCLIGIITLANLRGMKESGTFFAFPVYLYIVTVASMVLYGLYQIYFGDDVGRVPFESHQGEIQREAGGTLGLFLLLRGFSSGAVALTGVEAIADGVPAFRKPQSRNAAITMMTMAVILGSLFFGVSVLAHHIHPVPNHNETVISQIGRTVFGEGPIYVVLQLATVAILTLAANTAYADFPRLSSIIARDGFLPRYLGNRGDRLVYSNGIIILAVAASALIIAFGGITTALIPLYAVGVFTSFTLSQTGMVVHHHRARERGWKLGLGISALGATATFIVLLIVAVTKFTSGAWVPVVVVPAIIALFSGIKRHYTRVARALEISPAEVRPQPFNHTVVVLVGRVHRGVIQALGYARSLRPQHLIALYISYEDDDREDIDRQWREFGINVDLEIKHSKYRELVGPVMEYLDDLDERWNNDTITVVVPEFVVGKWYEHLLHNQSALLLKGRLLFREGTVVTSVPYHLEGFGITPPGRPGAETARPAPNGPAAPARGQRDARPDRNGAPAGDRPAPEGSPQAP